MMEQPTENLFVVNNPEDELEQHRPPEQLNAEPVGDLEGLIPICVQHATGPQIDAATFGYDIAQMQKRPWAETGAKLSDYFNYGFNETSWRLYCMMQTEGEASLLSKSNDVLRRLEMVAYASGECGPGGAEERRPVEPPYDPSYPPHQAGYEGGRGGPYRGRVEYQPPGSSGGGPNPPAVQQGYNYKTKLCQRFAEGRCAKGADCSYAHGISELRTAPNTAEAGPPRDVPPPGSYYGRGPPPQQSFSGNGPYRPPPGGAFIVPPTEAGGAGFRMPPKRARMENEMGDIYEPQY